MATRKTPQKSELAQAGAHLSTAAKEVRTAVSHKIGRHILCEGRSAHASFGMLFQSQLGRVTDQIRTIVRVVSIVTVTGHDSEPADTDHWTSAVGVLSAYNRFFYKYHTRHL